MGMDEFEPDEGFELHNVAMADVGFVYSGAEYNEAAGKKEHAAVFLRFYLTKENGDIIGSEDYPRTITVGGGWEEGERGGWRISDDGLWIEKVDSEGNVIDDPRKQKIHKKSRYFLDLIDRAINQMGVDLSKRVEKDALTPRYAKIWEGLVFDFEEAQYETLSGGTGKNMLPVAFIGERESTGGGGATGKKADPDKAFGDTELPASLLLDTKAHALDISGDDDVPEAKKLKRYMQALLKNAEVKKSDTLKALVMEKAADWYAEYA